MTNSIDPSGPLAFRTRRGTAHLALFGGLDGTDTIKVEARQLVGHQKDAVVTEGQDGQSWRLPSDEGAHLKGTDLAPFPLGFFNAGLQGDLFQRIRQLFHQHGKAPPGIEIDLVNHYWLTGSFALGTGEGHAEPTDINIRIASNSSPGEVNRIVGEAIAQSPAIDLLRTPIENTFSLYINGRRRQVAGVPRSDSADAPDPFLTYRAAPRPIDSDPPQSHIVKSDRSEGNYPNPAPVGTPPRTIRNVQGKGSCAPDSNVADIESWLEVPNASHFNFKCGVDDSAPSGLALVAAGVAFCYMTQLARYIETMKMNISGVRMVQFNPFSVQGGIGHAHPIDTHLFLNGAAPEETHLRLLQIAANTCYLHATAAARIAPVIRLFLNGEELR